MIRTKLFTRCLADVPWLLAAGLVLGWTPVAAAEIRLSVDKERVHEEAGRTEITVTAKNYDDSDELANVPNDTYVNLTPSTAGLNSRFNINLPTLIIRQGESRASGTIIFIPIDDDLKGNDDVDDGIEDDLNITISGSAGATPVLSTSITLIDDDKASQNIRLTFSPATLSKRAGPTEIVVTAELDGTAMTSDVSFQLLIDEASSSVRRDTDYSATLATIEIRRRKASGTATITITPKDRGTGIITLKGTVAGINVIAGQISITTASLGVTSLTATPASVRENAGQTEIALTVTLDQASVVDETVTLRITSGSGSAVRDVDYRATLPPNSEITISAGNTRGTATLTFTPLDNDEEDGDRSLGVQATASGGSAQTVITILDDETLIQSIELSVNPTEIREDAGASEVTITAILIGKALDEDLILLFQTDASTAIRDVDYERPGISLTIPAGQTQGSGTVTITPIDDETVEPNETITLRVASNPQNEDGDPIAVGTATITLKDPRKRVELPAGDTRPTFAGAVADLSATVGTAIVPVVLPIATGDGILTYSVSTLPAGLTFNAATQTLAGIPTAATDGAVSIVYTVLDGDAENPESAVLRFTIEVAPKPPLAISVSGHSSIREDAGPTEITLTATLAEATPADGTVQFELVPSSAGTPAVRGVDYEVRLPSDKTITIPAGETKGMRTITLNPLDNAKMDGRRSLSVRVTALGDSAQTDITITDDETPSTSIVLSVRPHTINEQDGRTSVEVTATLDGQALTEDTTVPLSVDYLGSTATSGADYAAVFNPDASLVILSGSITGSRQFVVVPVVDTLAEGDETIRLIGVVDGLEGAAVDLTLSDPAAEPTVSADPDSSGSSTAAPALEYTVGVAITPLVLAEVEGGTGERSYGVSDLPAGLTFDAATRTIAGTPTAVTDGPVTVTVTVTDEAGAVTTASFSITVNPPSSDSSLRFAAATANQEYTVGAAIPPLVLPTAMGGTGERSYSVSGLPAGLTFDAATRTIAGTPTAATDGAVTVTYTVIDEAENTIEVTFSITINEELTFGDLFDLFGAGKVVPTALHDLAEIREFVVGQRVEGIVLPAASGGTAPLTYSLSPALPAGLTFDAATRTIAGTPTAAAETAYTYTVTDANGASVSLSLQTRPTAFSLADNFPNPFNPATTIQYALPQAAEVELTVYNVIGQPVRTLVAEHQSAGRYAVEWDATNDSGHSLSSGMYFYRLQAGEEFREVKKMLLLR